MQRITTEALAKQFIDEQIAALKEQIGDSKVLLALSGGVDSSVTAALLIKAIGKNLVCVHVNHGLLRKGESEQVIKVFRDQLGAELIYCFEKDGVLADKDDDASVIPLITPAEYARLKASGAVADGMIPKLDNSFKAIASGVGSVIIKHARNLLRDVQTTLRAE